MVIHPNKHVSIASFWVKYHSPIVVADPDRADSFVLCTMDLFIVDRGSGRIAAKLLSKLTDLSLLCVLPARLLKLGFLLGQEAADRGSADFKLAGDLGFADAFAVKLPDFDAPVNHRWRAAEAFA